MYDYVGIGKSMFYIKQTRNLTKLIYQPYKKKRQWQQERKK